MRVVRRSCREGAKDAQGLTVVIDVFRAFTCAPLFFHYCAERVILEADPEKARHLKQENPAWVLVGEINEVPLEDADLGNSPTGIMEKGPALFHGKTVIHRTTAGVTGVIAALKTADEVLLGSFVMAEAISTYIRKLDPNVVTLVAMGDRGESPAPEDEACADYLEHLLTGKPYDPIEAIRKVLFQETAQKFLRGEKAYLPREDPLICLQRNLFGFVLLARTNEKFQEVKKISQNKI
ncbi:MAG: 2-phosphosulfolactate phosphatase [Deltaproteobacteria bacterium]|nr:2-phosphosulfolactate phosphatase [Deltaproteobacteria bacterium]